MQVAQSIPHAAKIFSGTASEALASEICSHFGCDSGKLNIQRFADGEISPNFLESVR